MTVIGVSAQEFFGLDPTRATPIRVPVTMRAEMSAGQDDRENRRSRWVQFFARLKPGVSVVQAKAQMQSQFRTKREM